MLELELTVMSSTSGRATATFLYFYVSHASAAKFLRGGEKTLYLFCR